VLEKSKSQGWHKSPQERNFMSHRTKFLVVLIVPVLTVVLFPYSPAGPANVYITDFANTENPISEGGRWTNGKAEGVDWFDVETTPGRAFGNQTTGDYTDPTALLKGSWDSDQSVTAKVFCSKPTSKYYQEVEIRLRSTITAHRCTGYEILWRCLTNKDAYTQVVRWNGPVGNFTYLDDKHMGVGNGVADGDIVSASIVGDLISVYRNGSLLFTANDKTYKTGNPGIGFNYGVGTTNADFGFTSFAATNVKAQEQSHLCPRADKGAEINIHLDFAQAASCWDSRPVFF
jgi:hypothetical protein